MRTLSRPTNRLALKSSRSRGPIVGVAMTCPAVGIWLFTFVLCVCLGKLTLAAECSRTQPAPVNQPGFETNVTVTCKLKAYRLPSGDFASDKPLQVTTNAFGKREPEVRGFVLEILHPLPFRGKEITIHHDPGDDAANPFRRFSTKYLYQFEVHPFEIGATNFWRCSVGWGCRQLAPAVWESEKPHRLLTVFEARQSARVVPLATNAQDLAWLADYWSCVDRALRKPPGNSDAFPHLKTIDLRNPIRISSPSHFGKGLQLWPECSFVADGAHQQWKTEMRPFDFHAEGFTMGGMQADFLTLKRDHSNPPQWFILEHQDTGDVLLFQRVPFSDQPVEDR
jgi:hypothetical protein